MSEKETLIDIDIRNPYDLGIKGRSEKKILFEDDHLVLFKYKKGNSVLLRAKTKYAKSYKKQVLLKLLKKWVDILEDLEEKEK